MPWTADDAEKHNKGLSLSKRKKWSKTANSVLSNCLKDGGSEDDCAAKAIRIANFSVKESERRQIDVNKLTQERDNKLKEIFLKEHGEYGSGLPLYNTISFYGAGDLEVEIGNVDSLVLMPFVKVNDVTFCMESIMSGYFPFNCDSVSSLKIHNFFEYFAPEMFRRYMEEAYHVLKGGGKLEIKVPSTEGKNAFGNPNYRSYFNELSFSHFVDEDSRLKFGTNAKFKLESLKINRDENGFVFVEGVFISDKDEMSTDGVIT